MAKILIISATFYQDIAKMLEDSACSYLKSENYDYEIIEAPGCFEIPSIISFALETQKYDGFIALGCVIRGQTTHYDYVCSESASGLTKIAIDKQVAIGYGIITSENMEQALARADMNKKNVGGRAAKACIDMIKIKKKLNNG